MDMRRYRGLLAALLALMLSACAGVIGGGRDAPAIVEVVCQDGTHVRTPVVQVQSDGVHLRADNRTGAERYIYKQEGLNSALNQHYAPAGVSEAVSLEAPGSWRLICSPPPIYPQEDSSWAELEVLDPDGLWVSDRLDCEDIESTHPDYFEDLPAGHTGDLLELAKREVPGQMLDPQPGDVVEPAGYPDAHVPQFRVVRDGLVVAVASYRDDGRGGWLFGSIDYCVDEVEGHLEPSY